VRVELPNDKERLDLVTRCLHAVALRFSHERMKVDTRIGNAARIVKVYGTLACKGENMPERPHRRSGMIVPAGNVVPVPREAMQRLADTLPPEETKPPTDESQPGAGFDLTAWWIAEHNLPASDGWTGTSGKGLRPGTWARQVPCRRDGLPVGDPGARAADRCGVFGGRAAGVRGRGGGTPTLCGRIRAGGAG